MPTIVYSATWDVDLESPLDSLNASQQTTIKHTGAGALRLNPTADVGYWTKTAAGGTPTTLVMQAYVYFATLPSATTNFILGARDGGGNFGQIGFDQGASKFYCTWSGGGTGNGPAITTATWYKLDLRIGATGAVDAKVNGTDLTQDAGGGVLTINEYKVGSWATSLTMDMYVDDLFVSNTAADYPITSAITPTMAWIGAAG